MPRFFGTLGAVDETTRTVEILASTPQPVDGEALVTWDLARFLKHPTILWAHDGDCLPVARAEESTVRIDAEGLKMRVQFATCEANPHAEYVWQSIKQRMITAVSVGFDPGKSTTKVVNGQKIIERKANELLEVSFVSVPKDEDVGVIDPSQAASILARARVPRTDAEDGFVLRSENFRLDFAGDLRRLDKFDQTPTGGRVIPARIARTGILRYLQPDGTVRREYRPEEEVFKADSLATIDRRPVIDFVDHTELITPETYSRVTRGIAGPGRRDGQYVVSNLDIEDAGELAAIERGDRADISAGYACRLDFTPGSFEGEPYDAVQRDIRFNHVALCPPNRGRSGPDVGLRLDSNDEDKIMKVIKIDGREYEFGSEAHIDKLDALHKAEVAALQKRLDETEAEKDKMEAAKDESTEQARKAREEADATKKAAEDERKKRENEDERKIREGINLRKRAERLVAAARAEEDGEDEQTPPPAREDDPEKAKAEEEDRAKREEEEAKKMDGLSLREIKVLAIKAHRKDFDDKGKSDDYVSARFDALEESVKESRRIHGAARTVVTIQRRLDARDTNGSVVIDANDPVMKSLAAREQYTRNAWKPSAK